MTEIKDRVKLLRKSLKLKQQDMATALTIPMTAISKYENGKIKPSSDLLAKIAKVYNVNLNWLVTGIGNMFNEEVLFAATGTTGQPYLRLIKTNSDIKIENFAQNEVSNNDLEDLSLNDSTMPDEQLTKLAQKIEKPLTIEYFENGIKTNIKVYNPDGSVKTYFEEVKLEKYRKNLKQKIDEFSDSKEKLEFIELAINSFEDNEAFEKLKLLVKGMELAQKK